MASTFIQVEYIYFQVNVLFENITITIFTKRLLTNFKLFSPKQTTFSHEFSEDEVY